MHRVIATVILITTWLAACSLLGAAEWMVEVVGPGTSPEIAVDDTGTVHLAFAIEMPGGAIYYAHRENDGWDVETALAGYFAAPLDLAVDGDGKPHIVAHDHHEGDAVHLAGVGSSWRVESVFSGGHDGWNPSIAIGPDGTPHIASFDGSEGVEYGVRGASGWQVEGVGTGSISNVYGAPLAIDTGGIPHLCYHDGSGVPLPEGSGSLYLATRTAGEWTSQVVDDDGDVGKFSSLALDSYGQPHVAYLRFGSTTAGVRYAHRDGGTWFFEDVPGLDGHDIDRATARRAVTLALDAEDRPHIVASDAESVLYAHRSASGWATETVTVQSSDEFKFGQLTALALDPEGNPHIGFFELPAGDSSSVATVYYASLAPQREIRRRTSSRRLAPSRSAARTKINLKP